MIIEKLQEAHKQLIKNFSCVEDNSSLASINSKLIRRVRLHSKEMDNFLLNEALSEQSLGNNTTHLLLDDTHSKILAYVSLCADAIPLELQERQNEGLHYFTAPALKIIRLAVDSHFHGQGLGKKTYPICNLLRSQNFYSHSLIDYSI